MKQTHQLCIEGMTCPNCERRIETAIGAIDGVLSVKADFKSGTATVECEPEKVSAQHIIDALTPLGYTASSSTMGAAGKKKPQKWRGPIAVAALLAVVIFVIVLTQSQTTISLDMLQTGATIGYGVLFIIGLVTSLHCVVMCGGISLSLCASYKPSPGTKAGKVLPGILYNAGRVLSYTLVGGIVGSIGAVINISPNIRGVASILAGTFMLIMGLGMLDIPLMRKITPKMPRLFGDKLYKRLGSAGPFAVGLLNGLMPCGPLQSVQLYALGTGSFVSCALSMFMFALGTVPLLFGLGAAGGLLSQKATRNMMKIGAALVAALGLFMLFMGIMNAMR